MPRATLLRAIAAMLPVDADVLGAAIDEGGLGCGPLGNEVTAATFLAGGLYAWVRRHEEEHRRCRERGPPPSFSDRAAWFAHWDFGQRGEITPGEVLRALLRSLSISSLDRKAVDELRRRLERMWDRCNAQKKQRCGHCTPGVMSFEDFSAEDGLGDLLEDAFGVALAPPAAAEGGGLSGLLTASSSLGERPRAKRRPLSRATMAAAAAEERRRREAEALQLALSNAQASGTRLRDNPSSEVMETVEENAEAERQAEAEVAAETMENSQDATAFAGAEVDELILPRTPDEVTRRPRASVEELARGATGSRSSPRREANVVSL